MEAYVNLNGKILPAGQPAMGLIYRAFHYGV